MTPEPTYSPHNPHPLSTLRTELVWEGKYDEYSDRREVDIAGCAMPFASAFRYTKLTGQSLNMTQ
ncbi:MAG: hypothetical protein ACRC8A_18435 [Microcoleaceae cyanobacterium]